MASRYDNNGFGHMSFSYHQERAFPRFVSATPRHYPGSSDRLHRLPSPSSAALSNSPRIGQFTSSYPLSSPALSSTSIYTPKRSVSYTAGLSLGEGGERNYSPSLKTKRTSVGSNNGFASGSFLSNSSSVYDASSVYLRNASSSYYRNTHHNAHSPSVSSSRLTGDSAFTRLEHCFLSSARNLLVRRSPLALASQSVGNSPPDSPPTKNVISMSIKEKFERERHLSENCIDKNKREEKEAEDLAYEKIGTNELVKKRTDSSPPCDNSPKIQSAEQSPPKRASKSPSPVKTASVCDSDSFKSNFPEPIIPPPPQNGLFTQLEKMIKMSNFDQGKFQKHVRSAVQQNETREMEKAQTDQQIMGKSLSAKRSPSVKERKSPSEGRSLAKERKSPANLERNESEYSSEKTKAHSKSLSPARNSRRTMNKEEAEGGGDVQMQGKRWARRARTVENLMDELQREGGTRRQMTPEGKKELYSRNSPSREYSSKEKQQRLKLRPVPPLLLVTSPSMGGRDEDSLQQKAQEDNADEDGAEAEATAVLTLTAPEGEDGGEEAEDYSGSSSSYDEDEEYSDEEYTDEEEWESDEGEWDEATVSRTLQLSGHESDFEFPFALGSSVVDKGNSNVLAPPPIFTASISYDGMSDSWGGRSYSDEGTNSASYTEPSGDEVEIGFTLVQKCAMRSSDEEFTSTTSGSYTSATYTSSFDEEEEEEDEEGVEDEQLSAGEGNDGSVREVLRSHRSRSPSASSSGESAESVCSEEEQKPEATELKPIEDNEQMSVAEESSLLAPKSPSPMLIQMAEETEQMSEGHATVEELGGEEMNLEELKEFEEQGIDGSKEVRREETYVRAQELRDGQAEEATRPLTGQNKPRTDFAKKAVVQPMRQEKLSVTEQKTLLAPDEQKIREEEERKRKIKEEGERKRKVEEEERKKKMMEEEQSKKARKKEEEERKKKIKEQEERKKRTKEEEERKKAALSEDKSAQRKSMLNMHEQDRLKAEQAEKELARQKSRATGAVEEKSKQYTTKTEDPIAYKRSKALEPKSVDEHKKRTFQPIQKPDPKAEEAFEKQMAELREQMRQGTRKLQSEFRDVSQGLKSASDEAKLKTKEEQHRTVMDKASSAFGKAEQEKRRQRELQESEAERAKREKEEKENKEREKREKEKKAIQPAVQATKAEPKRTVRRAAKETAAPQSEDAKKGEDGAIATKAPPKTKSYWERGTRRKTEELMKFKGTPTGEEGTTRENAEQNQQKGQQGQTEAKANAQRENRRKKRRTTRNGHRRRPFTRAPFDIDELMGWRGLDTFERMEAFFASRGAEKRPLISPADETPQAKRRGTEAQKVWISELRDIDKLYKASELRDIKLSAGA